jgi:site-specific DNA recombinase
MASKAALYARVSSVGQVEKDLSIPAQLSALKKYAAEHNITVVAEFVDEAETGTDADRPDFQRLISSAKAKEKPFEVILVWKLNRAFRNVEDAALYEGLLRRKGISLISITEPIPEGPTGDFYRNITHVFNQFFSDQLSSDIRRGLARAASEGSWCRPAPTGYRVVKVEVAGRIRNHLELDPIQAPIIKEIFEMALAGLGGKNIAKKLNERGSRTVNALPWTSTRILSVLRNEHYTGTMVFGRTRKTRQTKGKAVKNDDDQVIRNYDNHPALVSRENFERIKQLIASRTPHSIHPRQVGSKYLLSSLLRCSCGSAMTGHSFSNGRYQKYACSAKMRSGSTVCTAPDLDMQPLEDAVLERLSEFILTPEHVADLVRLSNEGLQEKDSTDQVKALESELKTERRRLERLIDLVADGDGEMPELKARIRATRQYITELEQGSSQLVLKAADEPKSVSESYVQAYVSELRYLLDLAEPEQRKSMLRSFVKRITVNVPNVTIEYTLPVPESAQTPVTCIDKDSVVALPYDLRQPANASDGPRDIMATYDCSRL